MILCYITSEEDIWKLMTLYYVLIRDAMQCRYLYLFSARNIHIYIWI